MAGRQISSGLSLTGFEGLPTSKDLILGIRPDALRQDDSGQLAMRVDLVEQHGADNLIYGAIMNSENTDSEETEFFFKTGQNVMPELESTLKLGFDTDKTLLFNKESGDRLR